MKKEISLLKTSEIPITDLVSVRVPTVGEILEIGETLYYHYAISLTSTPFDAQVVLHCQGIDYESIDDYDLFYLSLAGMLDAQKDNSLILSDAGKLILEIKTPLYFAQLDGEKVFADRLGNVVIDKLVALEIAEAIRKVHSWKRNEQMPGNKAAKQYILEKKIRQFKRAQSRPSQLFLEPEIIALVNNANFPYNYQTVMDLNIYQFNQSMRQILHVRNVDCYLHGIYSGCIDASKIDQKVLNIILPIDQ